MTRINLLPWRDALRKERQRGFLTALAVSAALALSIVGLVHLYLEQVQARQDVRNDYIGDQITLLNAKLGKIRKLEKERKSLLDRMSIIQRLQITRPEIVHLFDEIPRRIPDGVYLTDIKQNGNSVTIDGVAQSNARVSSFMRNLNRSEWFTNPRLAVIKTVEIGEGSTQRMAEFTLNVMQVNPELPKDAGEDGGRGG